MGLFGGDDESEDYLNQALQQFQNVTTPTAQQMEVNNLPQETVQGQVTPQQIAVSEQAPSALNNISLDPSTRSAEMSALGGFQNIAGAGGLDANAMLGINQAEGLAQAQNAGMQGSIMQNAQAQGNGTSAAILGQREQEASNAANTAATSGLQQAAEAENNRQAALTNMANIGGNINASDYGQAANTAASQNTVNATNAGYQNAANTANVANNMSGQQFNVTNAQGVNAANTTANQSNAYYNAQLPQQVFNDQIQKAAGAAGVQTNQGAIAQQQSNQNAAMMGKLIGAAGTIGGAAVGGPVGAAIGSTVASQVAKPTSASAGVGAAGGGVVPGQAQVPGDSVANDTVPIAASPGELVIPRSVPKTGASMEKFAKHAPIAGDTSKRVNLVDFFKKKKEKMKDAA